MYKRGVLYVFADKDGVVIPISLLCTNNAFPLQWYCKGSAVVLQKGCSNTAKPLQHHCIKVCSTTALRFAVSLQHLCSYFAFLLQNNRWGTLVTA